MTPISNSSLFNSQRMSLLNGLILQFLLPHISAWIGWKDFVMEDMKPDNYCNIVTNTPGQRWMVKVGDHDDELCEPGAVFYQEYSDNSI